MRTLLLIVVILTLYAIPNSVRADACEDGPPIQLSIGIAGVVAPEIDRLQLRMLPAVGTGVEDRLIGGMMFIVIDGPSCNGGFNWWRVELRDGSGRRGWLAEGDWQGYYVLPNIDGEQRFYAFRSPVIRAMWLRFLAIVT
jgi:hypothetical protein